MREIIKTKNKLLSRERERGGTREEEREIESERGREREKGRKMLDGREEGFGLFSFLATSANLEWSRRIRN